MEYFESDVPLGDGVCSDNSCPCPEVAIPRGAGYLYIDQSLVDFRRQYPTIDSARMAMNQGHAELRANLGASISGFYRLGPILVCEQGAKLRLLDLDIAAADAKYWWKTGLVPLRVTPIFDALKGPGNHQRPSAKRAHAEAADSDTKAKTEALANEPQAKSQGYSEFGRCTCETPGHFQDFICKRCGKARGWQPISLPTQDEFRDVTCAQCSDILIPGRASFFLEVLGKLISCPLCGTPLKTSSAGLEKWDMTFLQNYEHLDSEISILNEVERLNDAAKGKLEPQKIAKTRAIPFEVQFAGLLLLEWIERHSNHSEKVINAVVTNWAGHIHIGMIANDGFEKLSMEQKEGFLVMMHYASAFIHQVDIRVSTSKAGHGLRGLLILNLLNFYPDWKESTFGELPFDGRLWLEELVYSLKKDKDAYPEDSKKASSWAEFDQTLKSVIPSPAKAKGCRKSTPRSAPASKKKDCFVVTAAYTAEASQVKILRRFRDEFLITSEFGRRLIRSYNILGPRLADFISQRDLVRFLCRLFLQPFAWGASITMRCKRTRRSQTRLSRR
jgi:hypothetical protein